MPDDLSLKTVVAATDFSEAAGHALARAAQLARAHGAQLHLLHVPSHGRWAQGTGMFSKYLGDGNAPSVERDREHLERNAAELARRYRVSAECHVVPGRKAAEEIAAFSQAREADLVVLASHGAGGLRLGSVGGTALKVLWSSLVPVLMVRGAVTRPYAKLLVATDLSERARHLVETARAIVPKASLTLLHAFRGEFETALELVSAPSETLADYRAEQGETAARELDAFWQAIRGTAKRDARQLLVHGHPVSAVLAAADEFGADLVALGKHAGPRWEERVIGSVVQNLLRQLRSDVLVIA